MSVDKEATDIWKFGRHRPDLSIDETMAAPEPDIDDTERDRRRGLMSERAEEVAERLRPLLEPRTTE